MRYIALLGFICSGCTLFSKTEPKDDELVQLTDDVLKKGQGIEIDVKPIPKDAKK